MTRGELRIYLGAAPGVGKTYRMLDEARLRRARGTDVVVGFVETHGRAGTAALLGDLEVVPRRTVPHRGAVFEEMDLAAVLERAPEVALVDELAHANAPGSVHEKRWQDIEALLDAGISVVSTVDVQHLASLNDVVEDITGTARRETVPDSWVRRADQVELVDATPETLRRRVAEGDVYGPARIDAALADDFRTGDLTALRELALLWLADRMDDQLDRYRAEHGVAATWESRERVVVALAGGPEGDTLVRRAARVAARGRGADLMAVHVADGGGPAGADPAALARQRVLVEELGGTFHHVVGEDVPKALIEFARGVNATQLVLGASRRGVLAHLLSPGVGMATTARAGSIDVHLVTHEGVGSRVRSVARGAVSRRRRMAGFVLALVALPLLAFGVGLPQDENSFPSGLLLVLATVTTTSLVGGLWPAVLAAVAGFVVLNFLYTSPYRTLDIDDPFNVLALVVFLVVAVSVSVVVDQAARRTREAALASAEARTLAAVAGNVLSGSRPLEALLEQLRETFSLDAVALMERRPGTVPGPEHRKDPAAWTVAASVGGRPGSGAGTGRGDVAGAAAGVGSEVGIAPGAGRGDAPVTGTGPKTGNAPRAGHKTAPETGREDVPVTGSGPGTGAAPGIGHEAVPGVVPAAGPGPRTASGGLPASGDGFPCRAPGEGDVDVPVDDTLALVLCGRRPDAGDRRIIEAFAARAALALRQGRLADEAATAKPLAEADRMRTALLAAVSHDLRAPLASAKASVTSLRSEEVSFGPEDQAVLLATADESLDRLADLVADLLDMSRLQAGVMGVSATDLPLRESVFRVLGHLGERGRRVRVELPDDGPESVPPVLADPGLLERVLANLLDNALRFSPADAPPTVAARRTGDERVEVRVVDHGPGVSAAEQERMFVPFQRLGDTDNETGLGLGLALSKGLVEAMGGTLEPDTTPGGGLTMRVTLPVARA